MFFPLSSAIASLGEQAQLAARASFDRIDAICEYNQQKVLRAFADNRVSETYFAATTGYGYGDRGREALDAVFAQVMEAPDALVRHTFAAGTHALCCALFGLLRPGKTLLSVTGKPYDTLDDVIGLTGHDGAGSLKDFGVSYRQVEMDERGICRDEMLQALADPTVSVVFFQRSKGYAKTRPSLSSEELGSAIAAVKQARPDVLCMVDNCYGEFVGQHEPTAFGADLIVGSLIKNPGGGLAKAGAYLAGTKEAVELVSYRMTAPGIGRECGPSLGQNRDLFQGLFLAPHMVAQALKTAEFAAQLYALLGFSTSPNPGEVRNDIIQAVAFDDADKLIAFCQGVQKGSPVDAFVVPQPWDMPGYQSPVIMAAGGFVSGSSLELSADGPLRPPYVAYLQGALTYESGKLGVLMSAQTLLERGLIEL